MNFPELICVTVRDNIDIYKTGSDAMTSRGKVGKKGSLGSEQVIIRNVCEQHLRLQSNAAEPLKCGSCDKCANRRVGLFSVLIDFVICDVSEQRKCISH